MPDWHFYETAHGHRLPHDPFKAIVAPRPIGWISTVDTLGRPNLAPYSFFNAVCESPPIVAFSSSGRKDTQANIEATGEFVVNLTTRELAEAVSISSAAVPAGHDEFLLAGLESLPCTLVKPQRVARSPAALECRLLQFVPLSDLDGARTTCTLIIGQVVAVHLNTAFLRDGKFDMTLARTLARCGYGGDYLEASSLFEVVRPPAGTLGPVRS